MVRMNSMKRRFMRSTTSKPLVAARVTYERDRLGSSCAVCVVTS